MRRNSGSRKQGPAAWLCGPFAKKTGHTQRPMGLSSYHLIGALIATLIPRERDSPWWDTDTEITPTSLLLALFFPFSSIIRTLQSYGVTIDSHYRISFSLAWWLHFLVLCPLSFVEVYCLLLLPFLLSFILIWYTLKTVPDLYSGNCSVLILLLLPKTYTSHHPYFKLPSVLIISSPPFPQSTFHKIPLFYRDIDIRLASFTYSRDLKFYNSSISSISASNRQLL